MSRKLMLLAAVPFLFAGPALAQSDQAPAASDTEAPPPAATDTMTPDAPMPDPAMDSGTPTDDTAEAPTTESLEGDVAPAAGASGQVQILTEEADDQVLAADIIGMDAVDPSGNKIGKVDDVLIDSSGSVTGLILSTGEVLGLGGKSVGVSWNDVASAADADAITVNISEEQLTAAPEFRTKEDQMQEQTENAPPSPDQMAPAAGGATATQ